MQTLSTTEYELFKKHQSNRDIDPKLVNKIKKSVEARNLLEYRPILVNEKMEIFDGQHRLEVAKILNLKIYYQIKKDLNSNDIIILNNNQKLWKNQDYLESYCQEGFENYIKLRHFMEKHDMSLKLALLILNGKNDTDFFQKFRKGEYVFPSPESVSDSLEKKLLIEQIKDYVDRKTTGPKGYLDSIHLHSALIEFLNNESVIFDVFMKKLGKGINFWRPCTKQVDYFQMLKLIYNYNSRGDRIE